MIFEFYEVPQKKCVTCQKLAMKVATSQPRESLPPSSIIPRLFHSVPLLLRHSLVLLMPLASFSCSSGLVSISMSVEGPRLALLLGHQGYFLRRSSMLMALLLGMLSSGSDRLRTPSSARPARQLPPWPPPSR
jgi:hypothetical protein